MGMSVNAQQHEEDSDADGEGEVEEEGELAGTVSEDLSWDCTRRRGRDHWRLWVLRK